MLTGGAHKDTVQKPNREAEIQNARMIESINLSILAHKSLSGACH
jgi:hypothetical protein